MTYVHVQSAFYRHCLAQLIAIARDDNAVVGKGDFIQVFVIFDVSMTKALEYLLLAFRKSRDFFFLCTF